MFMPRAARQSLEEGGHAAGDVAPARFYELPVSAGEKYLFSQAFKIAHIRLPLIPIFGTLSIEQLQRNNVNILP